ncbi:unnamed protein product, partial [Linum tenue]
DEGDNFDYTSLFISDVVYDTRDEACAVARDIAQRNRFFLVVGSVKQNPGEAYPRVHMDCNHGNRSKSYTPDLTKTRRVKSKSGKQGCQFQVVVRASLVNGKCQWRILGGMDRSGKSKGFHNHKLEAYSEGSKQRNALSKEEKK